MQRPINVMMISSSYPQGEKDWKSIFIRQMLGALADKSDLDMTHCGPNGILPDGVTYACLPDESAWFARLMEGGGVAHLLRKGGVRRFTTPIQFLKFVSRACNRQEHIDLFHVNWLQNVLPLWKRKEPALVTVLGSDFALLKFPGMRTVLRHVIKNRRCVLAPNASWMVDELQRCFGDIAEVVSIPLGINDHWFDLYEKRQVVSPEQWLVVARLTRQKMGPLFDWGKELFAHGSGRELHLFGPMQEEMEVPKWIHYHGSTYPEELQKKWFPGAVGLVTTSQHDEGRPQVMLEAMAAGLPIIASNIAAHQNFITHQDTGLLVDTQEEFSAGIRYLSDPIKNQAIATAARKWVEVEIGTWSDCADRYLDMYRTLLGEGV